MLKKNIFLTLICLHLTTLCIPDSHTEKEVDPITQQKLDLYKKDYEEVSKNAELLTSGRFHSEICFYAACVGLVAFACSYFIRNQLGTNIGYAGGTLFVGGGAIGGVATINEHFKLKRCIDEKKELRSHIDKIQTHHYKNN